MKKCNNGGLEVKVHTLPEMMEKSIAALKIKGMGISIDKLTADQKKYLSSWNIGT